MTTSSKNIRLSSDPSQRTLRIINDSENDSDDDEIVDRTNVKKRSSKTEVKAENDAKEMIRIESSPLSKSSVWIGVNGTVSSTSYTSTDHKRATHQKRGKYVVHINGSPAMPAAVNVRVNNNGSINNSRNKTSSSSTSGYTRKSDEQYPPPHSSPLFSPIEDLSSESHRRRRQQKKQLLLQQQQQQGWEEGEFTSSMTSDRDENDCCHHHHNRKKHRKQRRPLKDRIRDAVTKPHLWQAFSVLVLVLTVAPVLLATLTMIVTGNKKMQNRLLSSYSNISAGYAVMLNEHFSNAESLAKVRSQTTSIFSLLSGDISRVARADYETLSRYSMFSEMYIITRNNHYFRVFMIESNYYIWRTLENGTLCQLRVENPTAVADIGFVQEWCTQDGNFQNSPLYLAVDNATSGDARWTGTVYVRPRTYCHSIAIFSDGAFSHVFGACLYEDGAEELLGGNTQNEAVFVVDATQDTVVGASRTITAHRKGGSVDQALPVSKVDDYRVSLVNDVVSKRYGTWSALAEILYMRGENGNSVNARWNGGNSSNRDSDNNNAPFVLTMNVGNSTIVSFVRVSRPGFTFVVSVIHFYGKASVSGTVVGVIIAVTVVCGSCMGIFIYCVVRPLKTLSRDMVATTDLKFVSHGSNGSNSSSAIARHSVLREMHDMQKSFEQLAVCTEALTKYISPEIALEVMRGNAIKPQKPSITIMFVSLCNFLPLLSSLPYKTLMIVLKAWFRNFGRAINRQGGTIDKYIDGCIMAIFGAPKPLQNNEEAACSAALHFYTAMQEVEKEVEPYFPNRLYYSVGVHCGPTFVGHIGYSERKCYTVIGNNANVASRVEKLTAIYGVSPLITGAVERTVKSKYLCVFLDVVYLRGHKTLRTKIYHLLGFSSKRNRSIELMIVRRFDEIHEKIRNGNKDIALELIERSLNDGNLEKYKRALEVLKKHVLSNTMSKNIYDSNTEDSDRSSSDLLNV